MPGFDQIFLASISLDCVIFGFHLNELRVLLLKIKDLDKWILPGGFVEKEEDLKDAALRVLHVRTGLENVYLTQFHTFGNNNRNDMSHVKPLLDQKMLPAETIHFLNQRFISIGYYSLVDFTKVNPQADAYSDSIDWYSLSDLPTLVFDHKQIIEVALKNLRIHLNYEPIGLNLLPAKFTMPELQSLYETVLGIKLDRRNFQRKMLGYNILLKHEERRKGGAHRSPYLYSFDQSKYEQALREGLNTGW